MLIRIDSRGIMFLAVDNLPTELPKEASEHFGDMLVPFLPAIAQSNSKLPFEQMSQDLPTPVYKAVVTAHGKLTPPYSYIAELRKANEKEYVE
jgi:alpha-aminoadipic semialdehyde synthase